MVIFSFLFREGMLEIMKESRKKATAMIERCNSPKKKQRMGEKRQKETANREGKKWEKGKRQETSLVRFRGFGTQQERKKDRKRASERR